MKFYLNNLRYTITINRDVEIIQRRKLSCLNFLQRKPKKAGCVSVGALVSVSVGHYIKEVKSTV